MVDQRDLRKTWETVTLEETQLKTPTNLGRNDTEDFGERELQLETVRGGELFVGPLHPPVEEFRLYRCFSNCVPRGDVRGSERRKYVMAE
jgi:hypothetical protein